MLKLNSYRRLGTLADTILVAGLGLLLAAATGPAAHGQLLFGANMPTFADWLPTNGLTDLPFRSWGTAASPFSPSTSVLGANGSIVADAGSVTYAQNYPSGTYTITFDSPSPVTLNMSGFFSQPSNIQRVGTTTTMSVQLTHDNGNVLAGMGWFTTSGVSASNPLSNFQMYQQGTTPAQMTSTLSTYVNKYQAVRWMNNCDINNNTNLMTAASNLKYSGANFGVNSYDDIARWTNQSPTIKTVMIEIPVNADDSFIAAVAQKMNAVSPNTKVVVEYGNENWNFGFTQAAWLLNQGKADSRVNVSDDFGKTAQEAGLRAAHMMDVFLKNTSSATQGRVAGFLGSQGSTVYFADQEKAAINRVYGNGSVNKYFKYQGISFYPGDGMNSASSVTDLYNQMESDINRQTGYLVADRNDANASGLSELVYEWSPNGYLTHGGVSQSIVDAFRKDPRSKQLTLDIWNAIAANLGTNGAAFDFTIAGDGWGTQINPVLSAEYEQQAIDQVSASLGVGSGTGVIVGGSPVPEPTGLGALSLLGIALLRRRSPRAATAA